MGYADLKKSDRVGIAGAARLAREHGYDYEILDDGAGYNKIKIISMDGTRTFGPNVTAGTIGKYFGYNTGGLATKKYVNSVKVANNRKFKND